MPAHPLAFSARVVRVARNEIGVIAPLLFGGLGLATFIAIADGVITGDRQGLDWHVLKWVHPYADDPSRPIGPWWLHKAAMDITALGGISVLIVFGLIFGIFFLMRGKKLSTILLTLGLAGGVSLSEGLKTLFDRPRPPSQYQVVEAINASFPSGHALLATVFYLSIGVMVSRAFPRSRLRTYVLTCSVIVVLLIGLTRIYLGAHWMSDVLAGWGIGAFWALVLWLIAYWVERRQRVRMKGIQDEP